MGLRVAILAVSSFTMDFFNAFLLSANTYLMNVLQIAGALPYFSKSIPKVKWNIRAKVSVGKYEITL